MEKIYSGGCKKMRRLKAPRTRSIRASHGAGRSKATTGTGLNNIKIRTRSYEQSLNFLPKGAIE